MDTEVYKVEGVEFKLVQLPEQSFTIGQTQVTQGLWEKVMGSNPSHFKGAKLPVESVSWYDSVRFCNKLSELKGLRPAYSFGSGDEPEVSLDLEANGYRLPTEAEWEYAARGGQDYLYAGSDTASEVGWYNSNSGGSTHPVGTLSANGFGLYDMSGNVWEWCNDRYDHPDQPQHTVLRALKGGGFRSRLVYISDSDWSDQAHRNPYPGYGLRLVRSATE